MDLTFIGFNLTFSQPVDASTVPFMDYQFPDDDLQADDFAIFDDQYIAVSHLNLSPDGRQVSVKLVASKPDYIYKLGPSGTNAVGVPFTNYSVCYTLYQRES